LPFGKAFIRQFFGEAGIAVPRKRKGLSLSPDISDERAVQLQTRGARTINGV
jgi:hypothetical protein